MDSLIILPKEDTPSVVLDKSSGIFEITGLSLPENPKEFYKPLVSWFVEYGKNPNPKTEVMFRLKYFNTSSAKQLIKVLTILTELHENGKSKVKIIWQYHKDDEDMCDFGENFQRISGLPFEILPLE